MQSISAFRKLLTLLILSSAQWRSEGNWRPGAKLNFAPPLKKILKNDIEMLYSTDHVFNYIA